MAKIPDIERILKSGTVRKKALLVAANAALHATTGKGCLTDKETNAIVDSIKLPKEGRVYNAIIDTEYNVRIAIPLIRADVFYTESLTNLLMQYCYVEDVVEHLTDGLNELIFDEGETGKEAKQYSNTGNPKTSSASERKRLTMRDKILKHVKPFLMELEPHEDVFVKATPCKTLQENLPLLAEKLKRQTTITKSRIKAIRDFLEERDVKIKPYTDYLDGMEAQLSEEKYPFGYRYGMKLETSEDTAFMERIKKLNAEKQLLYHYDDLPIDEKEYSYLLTGFLKV